MHRRFVSAMANAVDSSTPTAIRPAAVVASAAPMPPGTGIRPDRTPAAVFTNTTSARDRSAPYARHAAPSTSANSSSLRRLPPKSSSRLLRVRAIFASVANATRILGSALARNDGTDSTTATPAPRATPIATASRASGPPSANWLVSRSTRTNGSVAATSSALTTFSDTSSAAPAASAAGVAAPIRWRNRTCIAIRPAELGTVRLTNRIAAWSTTQGSSGSGVGTDPRTEIPPPIIVAWARTSATAAHARSAARSSRSRVPGPISAIRLISV